MGAYSLRQIETRANRREPGLEADLLDLQARIGVEGALGGGAAGADHEAAKGGDHRPIIGAQSWAWDPQLDARLFAAFSGDGAKA